MSGLAAVLAGKTPPGAYRWEAAFDVADVRHTVEHAGWVFAQLDGATVQTRRELHDAIAAALDFPDHYGRNLDALHDCLRDVARHTILLWESWGPFAVAEPRTFAAATGLLGDRLTVLLRGGGPEVDLPFLD